MNILVCTGSNSSYNSLRPEHEIYVSMARQGHKITIITHHNDIYSKRFTDHGINVIEQPITKKLSLTSIRLIRRTIKENAIEVVYATDSKSIPNTAFACIGLKVKLAAYRGTASGLYWHDPGNYLSVLNPRVDAIICVSDYVYQYVKSKKILKNKKIAHIYKGHDISWYNKPAADLSEFGIKPDDFTAICVTNARPHKGVDIVLKATQQLAHLKNFHLLLVGKGIDRPPYKELYETSEMKSRIHIAGYRNDAPELIAASKVLIQASTSGEGLPRVILESLAYGTPVIASANPGSMEIIEDNENGLTVPTGDPDSLANSIIKLYESPESLNQLSKNSKNVLLGKISHKQTVDQYINFFESLIKH